MTLFETNEKLEELSERFGRINFHYKQKEKELNNLLEQEKEIKKEAELFNQCKQVLDLVGELKREEAKRKLEKTVTFALKIVLERKDIEFKLEFDTKRNVPVVIPKVISVFDGEQIETEIKDGHGGGLYDIVAFVLRVLVLVWYRPKLKQFLILDEVFKHVSRQFLPNVAKLIKKLHDMTGIQFVLITHKDEFAEIADKVFHFSNRNGITKIEEEVK